MKRILFAGLVMICLSVTASAQKTSDKTIQKNRIEKTFKKGEGNKFEKSKYGKAGVRHKMWKRNGRKEGVSRKYGNRKMDGKKFKKGNTKRHNHNGYKRRS